MKDGCIVEQGTHNELMKDGNQMLYAELIKIQEIEFQEYIKNDSAEPKHREAESLDYYYSEMMEDDNMSESTLFKVSMQNK